MRLIDTVKTCAAVAAVVAACGLSAYAQGTIAVAGNGFDMLNGPYDAKEVGDYTGITPPFGNGDEPGH